LDEYIAANPEWDMWPTTGDRPFFWRPGPGATRAAGHAVVVRRPGDGEFAPEFHLGRVPLIRFTGEEERIIGLYDDIPFPPGEGPTPLWILNGSTRPFVELLPDGFAGPHMVTARDKFGCVITQETVTFPIPRLSVEVGGRLEVG
jgi:hypothetical protein